MKKFAIFLPQFHQIPENDEWWGEGFTEWTNVKKALPLFKNHKQPKVPLSNNYYNLLNKDTVLWQTELMKKYKIDGMAYYHYYFKGKMLLEKPVENLLKWKDIDQPFFFYWANHTWNRSWEGKRTVLVEQEYGIESDWEEHFRYLLPFFKDERYLKIDNMPVFAIYQDFNEKNDMFSYFEKRCKAEGFSGLYLIETFIDGENYPDSLKKYEDEKICEYTKAIFTRQPSIARTFILSELKKSPVFLTQRIIMRICKILKIKKVIKFDGNQIMSRCPTFKESQATIKRKIIPGVFFEWDNTPRHMYRGYIINPISKDSFMSYMDSVSDAELVLINAWNEWAEGMILEPTEENEYKYLSWIKEWSEKNNL